MAQVPGVQVTLVTRDVDTPYSGMLPGHVAGLYTREECHIDLGKLANFAGARLVHAEACGIDRSAKRVRVRGRPDIPYDVLSINIGSAPQLAEDSHDPVGQAVAVRDSGAGARITPVKPIDGFSARWEAILARVCAIAVRLSASIETSAPAADAEQVLAPPHNIRVKSAQGAKMQTVGRGRQVEVVVVGGGAGGVELALSMHARLKKELTARGAPEEAVKVSRERLCTCEGGARCGE